MRLEIRRRSLAHGFLAMSIAACAGLSLGCGSGGDRGGGGGGSGGGGSGGGGQAQAPRIARKSAAALSSEEVDRFKRAFEYAVAQGFFDAFNDEHYDHARNRHHGADVQATSPITIMQMSKEHGYRLLPWHRSFLIEAEAMLRAALRKRDAEEGRDPSEAELLFIPYWDAAHAQDLPQWILDFQPKGGTAIVPPGLPEGHAGYGKAVGDRYSIVFGRWPRGNLAFDTLQAPDYVGRILANTTFVDFYDAIDANPEVLIQNYVKAQAALTTLKAKLPEDTSVQTLIDAFSQAPGATMTGTDTSDALFEIDWEAAVEARKPTPDMDLIGAVKDVYSLFNFMPHLRMHLWAGGLDPNNANVRGTVTYFNELAVDPVFWMLHGEIDRYWYTWQLTHTDEPPLTGDDALFNPLTSAEGAWYGGGKTYSLDELTRYDALPYTYDAPFTP